MDLQHVDGLVFVILGFILVLLLVSECYHMLARYLGKMVAFRSGLDI